ncbi:MAG: hypothetical protein ACTSXA_05145 [Candidatus Heimdallarchaeota archaeon]
MDNINSIINELDKEDYHENRVSLIISLGKLWNPNDIRISILDKLLEIFSNLNEHEEVREVTSKYLSKIVNDVKEIEDGYMIDFVDRVILYHRIYMEIDYDKNKPYINQIMNSVIDMGIYDKDIIKYAKQMLTKKIDTYLKITAITLIDALEDKKKAVTFFMKRLNVKSEDNLHDELINRLDNYYRITSDWFRIESAFITLLSHKNSSFRKKGAEMLRDYGNRKNGEKEVITALKIETDLAVKKILIESLGTVGNNNEDLVLLLYDYVQNGENKQVQAKARSALGLICQITTFENWQELVKFYTEKKPQKFKNKFTQWLGELTREEIYFAGFVVSILTTLGQTINNFLLIDQTTKNIIGWCIVGFISFVIILLLILGISSTIVQKRRK